MLSSANWNWPVTCMCDGDSPGMSSHNGVSSMLPKRASGYWCWTLSFLVCIKNLVNFGCRPSGNLWLKVVLRRKDNPCLPKNFSNQPLLATKSVLVANLRAFAWTLLLVTLRFWQRNGSIHAGSSSFISGKAAFRPTPSRRLFLPGNSIKLFFCFLHFLTLLSSTSYFLAAALLLLFSAHLIIFNLNVEFSSSWSQQVLP